MAVRKRKTGRAVTLVGLIVAMLATAILVISTLLVLALAHRGYRTFYGRVHSEVVRNAYEARRAFDAIVRRSSIRRCDLLNGNNELYVYYYSSPQDSSIRDPDNYARFYLNSEGTELWIERGEVVPGTFGTPAPDLPGFTNSSTRVLAYDIVAPESGIFSRQATSVEMVFTLDNETNAAANAMTEMEALVMTVTTTAIRHNF
ncbi:MAG: hypothetical protein ACYSWO_02005 [Planctomycetota bacterium]|jgi:hypothetical protein